MAAGIRFLGIRFLFQPYAISGVRLDQVGLPFRMNLMKRCLLRRLHNNETLIQSKNNYFHNENTEFDAYFFS